MPVMARGSIEIRVAIFRAEFGKGCISKEGYIMLCRTVKNIFGESDH